MYDLELVDNSLKQIKSIVETICSRTDNISEINDFLCSPTGMMLLDAVCMNLIALGEAVKNLDKISKGELLVNYPEVYWAGVMRMRDKIAHHYFEIDAEVVLLTVKEDIPLIKTTINKMLSDLTE